MAPVNANPATGAAETLVELVEKLGQGRVAEVRDRAVSALASKVSGGLVSTRTVLGIHGLPQRLLLWINDRQNHASPTVLRQCIRLLSILAHEPGGAEPLRQAGCQLFLEEFGESAPAFRSEIEQALGAWRAPDAAQTTARPAHYQAFHGMSPSVSPAPSSGEQPTLPHDGIILSQLEHSPLCATITSNLELPRALSFRSSPSPPSYGSWQIPASSAVSPDGSWQIPASSAVSPDCVGANAPNSSAFASFAARPSTGSATPCGSPSFDNNGAVVSVSPQSFLTSADVDECQTYVSKVLGEIDAQMLMDISVRLGYGDISTLRSACLELREAVCWLPSAAIVLHPAICNGLTRALERANSGETSSAQAVGDILGAILAIFERRLREESDCEQHPLLPTVFFSTMVGVVRSPLALREPVLVPISIRCIQCMGTLTADSRFPFGMLNRARFQLFTRSIVEVLYDVLSSIRISVGSLDSALAWFNDSTGNKFCRVQGSSSDNDWQKPIHTHDWTTHALAIYDVLVRLLESSGHWGFKELGTECPCYTALLQTLAFDHRLLLERPSACHVVVEALAEVSPQKADEWNVMRTLAESVSNLTPCANPQADDGSNGCIDQLLRNASWLQRRLRLLILEDLAMRPTDIASRVLGLVRDVATLDPDSTFFGIIRDQCVFISTLLALCPVPESQQQFLALLESEASAGWLFGRLDFALACVTATSLRPQQCIIKWRQGDCESAFDSSLVDRHWMEVVETACHELHPSTMDSSLRRLFASCKTTRESATLALWREQSVTGFLGSGVQGFFVADLVGDIVDDARQSLHRYLVQGLRGTTKDFEHLCGIVSNDRLTYDVRASAAIQICTFVASSPVESTLAIKTCAGQSIALAVVEMLRSTPSPAAPLEGTAETDRLHQEREASSMAKFICCLCHTGSILILSRAPVAEATADALATECSSYPFMFHRNAVLDALIPLFFNYFFSVRSASLQLAACLLFGPGSLLADLAKGVDAAPVPSTSSGVALRLAPWIMAGFILPLSPLIAEEKPNEVAQFWGAQFTSSTISHCQLFHRLGVCPFADRLTGRGKGTGRDKGAGRVLQHTVRSLVASDRFGDSLRQVAMVPPLGLNLVVEPGYLPSMIGRIAQGSVISPCGILSRTSTGEELAGALERLFSLAEALPDSMDGDVATKSLQQLAQAMTQSVLPQVEMLFAEGECKPGDEMLRRRAQASVAGDPWIRRVVEILLRFVLKVAQRPDCDIRWLAVPRWIPLLTALLPCTGLCVRRLALATTCILLHLAPLTDDSAKFLGQIPQLLVQEIGASAVALGSRRHSCELKVALWLLGRLGLICGGDIWCAVTPGQALGCASSWINHVDASIRATSWRSYRWISCRHGVDDKRGAGRAEMVGRALRTLQSQRSKMVAGLLQESHVRAEALELVRFTLEDPSTSSEQRVAICQQVVEAKFLTGDVIPNSIATDVDAIPNATDGQVPGLRRSVIRLLGALLNVNFAQVNGIMVRFGLWPLIAGAIKSTGREDRNVLAIKSTGREDRNILDDAVFGGDVVTLIAMASLKDPQVVLWLTSATSFLESWHALLVDLVAHVRKWPVGTHRGARSISTHIVALFATMSAWKVHITTGSVSELLGELVHYSSKDVAAFFSSPAVVALLAEGMQSNYSNSTRQAAVAATANFYGLVLQGFDGISVKEENNNVLCAGVCAVFHHMNAQDRVPTVIYHCLINMLNASSTCATLAWNDGFFSLSAKCISSLLHRSTDQRAGTSSSEDEKLERLILTIRLVSSLLSSSREAFLGSVCEPTNIAASSACRTVAHEIPLASVLLELRSICEKCETVLLETLDLLLNCMHAGHDPSGNLLVSVLLRTELVQWLIRQSQRKNMTTPVYCKLLGFLSLCAPALSGKPPLLRFVAQLMDGFRAAVLKAAAPTEEGRQRQRRLLSVIQFLASLRPCARLAHQLVGAGCEPSAHTVPNTHAVGSNTGPDALGAPSASTSAGLDVWLDIIDVETRPGNHRCWPIEVRAASLRVILSVVSSPSPLARSCIIGSARALPLLLRAACRADGPIATLSICILWVLAHGQQRTLPAMRKLGAGAAIADALRESTSTEMSELELDTFRFVADQVCAILR